MAVRRRELFAAMRFVSLILLALAVAAPLRAQSEAGAAGEPPPGGATLLFALENTLVGDPLGWFGGQLELPVVGERLSAFGGLGYTPELPERGDPSGLSFAVGMRGYHSGSAPHRLFLEASFRQLGTGLGELLHGPALQAGYRYTAERGFTLLVSGGVGHPVDQDRTTVGDGFQPLMSLGLGYTWR